MVIEVLIGKDDDMKVHGNIVDDLHSALADLSDICEQSIPANNQLLDKMHEAAQVFALLYSSDVLRILLYNIYEENFGESDGFDNEELLLRLRNNKILTEDQYQMFTTLFGVCVVMDLDRDKLLGELVELYDIGYQAIEVYGKGMLDFFTMVDATYDLYDIMGEFDDQEH